MQTIKNPTKDQYRLMADLYNRAHKPFLNIYSEEEKEVFKDSFIETIDSLQEAALTRNIVCIIESDIVLGYAFFRKKNEEVVWISSLYVDPDFQKKKIGSFILRHIEGFGLENDCHVVALETHAKASWAINFYLKNGYELVNDKINDYPFDRILEKLPVKGRPLLAKIIR